MRLLTHLLWESFALAWGELSVNRLRTLLSLSGIAIGIFCVITILSVVDSLEKNLRQGISRLGSNVVYVNKFSWGLEEGQTEYPWWKYLNRPNATIDELRRLQQQLTRASAAAMAIWMDGMSVAYENKSLSNVTINGVTHDFNRIFDWDMAYGRYFVEEESNRGAAVAIVGADVAKELFAEGIDPVGLELELLGTRVHVIGVFRKEGKSVVDISNDNVVMIPYTFLSARVDLHGMNEDPSLVVEALPGVSMEELKEDIRRVMRAVRRLPPAREDNFSLNQISIIGNQITQLFGVVNVVAWIIGGFSVLVGGFGIANIMFVSVRERTHLIGIKKALGARNVSVMLEFLIESVILCLIGGVLGLLLVWASVQGLTALLGLDFELNTGNILRGVGISALIGILAGIFPARAAARLDPVVAMRFA